MRVCATHGGSVRRVQVAAEHRAELATAERAVVTLGLPVDVEPMAALREELGRANGAVRWLADVVADLDDVMVVSAFGTHPSPYIELYGRERDRLTRVAKVCVDAGLAEREVRIAEEQAEMLATAMRAFVRGIGHDPADAAVRIAMRGALELVRPSEDGSDG